METAWERIGSVAGSETNSSIESFRRGGKKILGYFCSYVPEELIHAAGFVPYRMRAVGSLGTAKGDTYFSARNCGFVRHCFDKALRGRFDFLDGVVFSNSCDHCRRVYDNWRDAAKTQGLGPDFLFMLATPHKVANTALGLFEEELKKLAKALEQRSGAPITTGSLAASVALYNRRRALLASLAEKRAAAPPPVKGSEMARLLLALTALPVEEGLALLEEIHQSLEGRKAGRAGDVRVLLTGGCMEDVAFIEMIEEAGASVVAENTCLGLRQFTGPVDETGDPLAALARRYLRRVSCPRMIDDLEGRMGFLAQTLADFTVEAVVCAKLMFCDLWGGEAFVLRKEAGRLDFPILVLERELYGGGMGQLKTRVQAFLETVENQKNAQAAKGRTNHG